MSRTSMLFAATMLVMSQPVFAQNASIAGRWTNSGNCSKWDQFTQSGSSWTYAEWDFDQGQPQTATVSTSANGAVTVLVRGPDYQYQFVIQMKDSNSFTSVEHYTSGGPPGGGKSQTYTYTRCP